jgi:hypothetical protein
MSEVLPDESNDLKAKIPFFFKKTVTFQYYQCYKSRQFTFLLIYANKFAKCYGMINFLRLKPLLKPRTATTQN